MAANGSIRLMPNLSVPAPVAATGPVLWGVRPEHLEPCAPADANITVEVDLIEPLGADTLAHGHVNGTRVIARLPAATHIAEGALPLRFAPANRHYFDPATGARIPL